jgi:hypothetical protein
MPKIDLKKLETRLRKGIETAFGSGLYMNSGRNFGLYSTDSRPVYFEDGGVCLMGSVLFGKRRDYLLEHTEAAAKILGVTNDQARALEWGYARWLHDKSTLDQRLVKLGARLRRDYT